jgi:hypothetical protein
MRDCLFWTVKRSGFSSGFDAFRVTRATLSRIYGSVEGISCHCVPTMIYGKFATGDEARAACLRVDAVWRKYADDYTNACKEVERVRHEREQAVKLELESISHANV